MTASDVLPAYPTQHPPSFARSPSYSVEPTAGQQRLAIASRVPNEARPGARPEGHFVKQSKTRKIVLALAGQDPRDPLPTYGSGASVEGEVNLSKPESIGSVELTIQGILSLEEIGEDGTVEHSLCLNRIELWNKDREGGVCPASLPFGLQLPLTFFDGKDHYPLPPTYECELSGIPGFIAKIEYSIRTTVVKSSKSLFGMGVSTVATPFLYRPRTRPSAPRPKPLMCFPRSHGFVETPEWESYDTKVCASSPMNQDIHVRMFLPVSRIFCFAEPIPFHLVFTASSLGLSTFMPFMPVPGYGRQATRMQIVRQSTCDVKNEVVEGTKSEMWRTDVIGEGIFKHAGDSAEWVAFSGEINVSRSVACGGFKAGGLFVKDYVVMTVDPPDAHKAPFRETRLVVPIRLTTDPWVSDGTGDCYEGSIYSVPESADEYVQLPALKQQ